MWTATDRTAQIRQLLSVLPSCSASTVFLPDIDGTEPGRALRYRAAIGSTLVASLELARRGDLTLQQAAPWNPIQMLRADQAPIAVQVAGAAPAP